MASIKIKMKDRTIRDFPHEGRAGGSWTKTIKYEGVFAIIIDEWGMQIALPVSDIKEVQVVPNHHW